MDVLAQKRLKFSGSFVDQSTVMFGSGKLLQMLFKVFKVTVRTSLLPYDVRPYRYRRWTLLPK